MFDEICRHCGFAGDVHAHHCPVYRAAIVPDEPLRREPLEAAATTGSSARAASPQLGPWALMALFLP